MSPAESRLTAAVIQLNSGPDKPSNFAAVNRLVRAAAGDGARLILLPEKWNMLGDPAAVATAAEELDGPSTTEVRRLALELGVQIVAGSIVERSAEGSFNTSLLIDAEGRRSASYRKLHLFDVSVGGHQYRESLYEQAGSETVVTQLSCGHKLGLSICYDLRFPELYRQLALEGAEIVTVAAAFTAVTTAAHWEVLLRARAVEQQLFVLAANQVGEHAEGLASGGRSMIIDPWGSILAEVDGEDEGYAVAELDFALLADIRAKLPSLASFRGDMFASARQL